MLSDTSFVLLIAAITYFGGIIGFPEDEGCIRIKDCPVALKHVKNLASNNESLEILRKAHCGYVNMSAEPVVKCNSIPDLKEENCVPLTDCPEAVKLIQENKISDSEVIQLFRKAHCRIERRQAIIKCSVIRNFVNYSLLK